jgi:hypothetical protein
MPSLIVAHPGSCASSGGRLPEIGGSGLEMELTHFMRFLKKGTHGGKLSRFRKTSRGKTLVVIAEIRNRECWIATAYYED